VEGPLVACCIHLAPGRRSSDLDGGALDCWASQAPATAVRQYSRRREPCGPAYQGPVGRVLAAVNSTKPALIAASSGWGGGAPRGAVRRLVSPLGPTSLEEDALGEQWEASLQDLACLALPSPRPSCDLPFPARRPAPRATIPALASVHGRVLRKERSISTASPAPCSRGPGADGPLPSAASVRHPICASRWKRRFASDAAFRVIDAPARAIAAFYLTPNTARHKRVG